jgi:CheY-like chemotaxis protein
VELEARQDHSLLFRQINPFRRSLAYASGNKKEGGESAMRQVKGRQLKTHQPIPSPLTGLRVLVVEDEGLIGLAVENFLEQFGCQIVGIAGSTTDALQIIRTAAIDVAVVDVKLENETAYTLADALMAAGRPFVFATGLMANEIDERYSHVPVVGKPFEEGELRGALLEAIDGQMRSRPSK